MDKADEAELFNMYIPNTWALVACDCISSSHHQKQFIWMGLTFLQLKCHIIWMYCKYSCSSKAQEGIRGHG